MAKQHHSVLGIDPSLSASGLALESTGFTARHTAPLKSKKLTGDARLVGLVDEIKSIAGYAASLGFPVALAVLEDLPTHAKSAGLTGRAQGVVRAALTELGIPYFSVSPAKLKQVASGKGNATKDDMRAALPKGMSELLLDDNQVDAWWLAEIAKHYASGMTAEHLALPEQLPAEDELTWGK